MSVPRFSDIPLFPLSHYEVDVELRDLDYHLDRWKTKYGLSLDPDFQRAHVWTDTQQSAFVEYILRGGEVGKTVIINAPGFSDGICEHSEIVDGKQRIRALSRFLDDEIPAFGHLLSEYSDKPRCIVRIVWRVVELDRRGVLDLYLSLNAGGTPHTKDELEKVRRLLRKETST